jgi:subtilisin family serine protease
MLRAVVTEPLLTEILDELETHVRKPAAARRAHPVIISLNELHRSGTDCAREIVLDFLSSLQADIKPRHAAGYVFATLTTPQILAAAAFQRSGPKAVSPAECAIHRIWSDHVVQAFLHRSFATVKADAAHAAFAAHGSGITWAVLDTGIDAAHPHFREHANLALEPPLAHMDFTGTSAALDDPAGHGTHVAGIIAGCLKACGGTDQILQVSEAYDLQSQSSRFEASVVPGVTGLAPRARLVSMKVLSDDKRGRVSSLLAALQEIQNLNQHGRRLLIHGVNLSLGYPFDPRWFACGQSPLCVEIDRLVRSGVAVVAAAGNSGYDSRLNRFGQPIAENLGMTINDPGNSHLAITVGSTHRDMPHTYGVSYFSSKGPTGDGRLKPDLLAPGERIVSCASAGKRKSFAGQPGLEGVTAADILYHEDSGTSMAAPHVSGAIAAFLSVRPEFIGQPEKVKEIFLASAIDLRRDRYFQGAGLLDVMKALQSV